MSLTIGETIQQLQRSLRDYIEATYHISHPALIAQRHTLLEQEGVIYQKPFLESTPRYQAGKRFEDLGIDPSVVELYLRVSKADGEQPLLIHNPPYEHQAQSIAGSMDGRSLMVMTGTGSGKTECFLLPILGKLASEAHHHPSSFAKSAARAIVLYPMNALVNDQLGRLRLLFADPRVVDKFRSWAGRPARFARYTSRTLYPGVRTAEKDRDRLAPIGKYYIRTLELAAGPASPQQETAAALIKELRTRGKWPAKPDLAAWYGKQGSRWQDSRTGEFKRCVTLPRDPELLTRHEMQAAPADVLVTNYSMLEYMLMRPLERPIFDSTAEWLEENKSERMLLVIDEAHLYRGAAGAEVALLIRRLRTRLNIDPERLQVICTSASFQNAAYARQFAAQLCGKDIKDFDVVQGKLDLRPNESPGNSDDAKQLAAVDIDALYEAETDEIRLERVKGFLEGRGVKQPTDLATDLYSALRDYGPLSKLINRSMVEARPVVALASDVFPEVDSALGQRAVTSLIALGSLAKRSASEPGLLPCRVHSFYRGLPGLWVCMDPACTALPEDQRSGPAGKLFSQPRDRCECGSTVLELFTCRNCGSAYARAYTDNVDQPDFLWPEAGSSFRTEGGQYAELEPIDLLLEPPNSEDAEPAEYDLITGRLNPRNAAERSRQVHLSGGRVTPPDIEESDAPVGFRGEFKPCGVCGGVGGYGRSSVQDHQTKGDQPFQALIAKQLQVQPPNKGAASSFAPLRGRKVLIFSDSRQTAARLAPNLQAYSTQDALRPLVVSGYARLLAAPVLSPLLCLEDLYFAVVLAAKSMGVRLRPELRAGESLAGANIVEDAVRAGKASKDDELLNLLVQLRASAPPEALLRSIVTTLTDRWYGFESLALASIVERSSHTIRLHSLVDIPGVASTPEQKEALCRVWLRCWNRSGFWLSRMPPHWFQSIVQSRPGKFTAMSKILKDKGARSIFEKQWLPELLKMFAEQIGNSGKYRLKGGELSLLVGGTWAYCGACRSSQRPFPGKSTCVNCGRDKVAVIDPEKDAVFSARKGYYRASTVDALKTPPVPPMALIAAEHTAQLNSAQVNEVFSRAEEHELLFQDVNLGSLDGEAERPAIDVLSCTTTMEVGIDIGTLSGVSLRNMPPGRANYQQRSGRAGRRGNAVATVTAFGSADSHDDHYFLNPDQMIRGPVEDPKLTLDNREIVRRHITAFLLQRYHQERLPEIHPEDQPQLFAVLGRVDEFKNPESVLNRGDFQNWMVENESQLKREVGSWLPDQLPKSDRDGLLANLIEETLEPLDDALSYTEQERKRRAGRGDATPADTLREVDQTEEATALEDRPEEGEEKASSQAVLENLLDRLLYKGVLPRYAFPTDVATFHVFDANASTNFRHAYLFTPSQGLSAALSQYAPGKEVWIANRLWTSGAIYSPIRNERSEAWSRRRLYYECEVCHYAKTVTLELGERGEKLNCDACGGIGTFGRATYWLRPPGFAHAINVQEGTSPDDQPERSYATRAKLTAPSPADASMWVAINESLRVHHTRQHLLVTNRGPRNEGYTYCTRCGLIEATCIPTGIVGSAHRKPYPDTRDPTCPGAATKGMVLGTDFITDVLLVSLRVKGPICLRPGLLATDVGLRTVAEALTKAACRALELEPSELHAEYRPALTPEGREGMEAEIYIYDTLPGGAGFAQRVGRLGIKVFQDALKILEACPEGCDRSCYRCLRNYKNKFEHELLDRHVGASLLNFLLTGRAPVLSEERLRRSTDLLFNDLKRNALGEFRIGKNEKVEIEGLGTLDAPILIADSRGPRAVVALHGPLTPDTPSSEALIEMREYSVSLPLLLVDELVVRRNLPAATSAIFKDVSYR